ncbi:DUF4232 domain-containing protein [Nonomuraea sp. NPDC049152]|uniref:DUF4232 domain-containing protein n=1 Tax=Nonomuraea sp. NPDC049152 TaxID=3154350 RepID=UPI0033E9286A
MKATSTVAALLGAAFLTPAAASASTAAHTAASSAAPARCTTGVLKGALGREDAGAGQRHQALLLTNKSAKSCWVYGFPGLTMVDAEGDALRTRVVRKKATPHKVILKPGKAATSTVSWTVVETGEETSCPASAKLLVYPPDERSHLEVRFVSTVCGGGRLNVTPFTAR